MNEEHTPQITNEQPVLSQQKDWKHHFTTVTPLSKFLAMLLFIALPFIGFGVGVEWARSNNTSNSTFILETQRNTSQATTETAVPFVPETWSLPVTAANPYTATIDPSTLVVPAESTFILSGTISGVESIGLGIRNFIDATSTLYAGYGGIPRVTVEENSWRATITAPLSEGVYQVSVVGPDEITLAKGVLVVGNPDTEKLSAGTLQENQWRTYRSDVGFSFKIPPGIDVTEQEESVHVGGELGYTIHYRQNLMEQDDVIAFAREVYGQDCDVELGEVSDIEESYYVLQPGLDLPPEERTANNCSAFKVDFKYSNTHNLGITWARGMEQVLPTSESTGNPFYDSEMLDSITFD